MQPGTRARLLEMEQMCERRYERLVRDGCDEGVAADRTFDAMECAMSDEKHTFDARDRLFENELRTYLLRG
jgi:hypothetical protein